jgi:hypothetical protein
MSRIYFHSPDQETEVSGSERAYMGCLINDIAIGVLSVDRFRAQNDPVAKLLPEDCYVRSPSPTFDFVQSFELWVKSGDGHFVVNGERRSVWTCCLNTALRLGGDPLKLFARLHGQCEIHCWVDGKNREWLAGIIDQGLGDGIFRRGIAGRSMGWEATVEMLRSRDDEPVVCSYSVCDQFPNEHTAGYENKKNPDAWYDLSRDKRWKMAMKGLRENGGGLEMKPDNWGAYRFSHGLSMFDIRRIADEANAAARKTVTQ